MRTPITPKFFPLLLLVLTLLLTLTAAHASTLIVDDQFARTAGPTAGANSTGVGVPVPIGTGAWIDHVGNSWGSASGKLTGTAAAGDFGVNYLYRPSSDGCADETITLYTDFTATSIQGGAYLRLTGAASSPTGYFLAISTSSLQIYKISAGTNAGSIGAATTISQVTGHKYKLVFSAIGTTISYSVWDQGVSGTPVNTQVVATTSVTDSTYPGSASTGQAVTQFGTTNIAWTRIQVTNENTVVPTTTISPSTAFVGASQSVTATGTATAWTTATTFSVTGGTGASISGTSVNASAQTATFTLAPGTAAGTLTLANSTDASSATVTVTALTISPSGGAFLYSPYTWLVAGGTAKTIYPGAYFRTLIGSTATCKINFTVNGSVPFSQCWARLDNQPWQQYIPSSAGAQIWTLTMPPVNGSPTHLLEFVMKAESEAQDHWNTQVTAVTLNGLTLDSGGTVTLPAARKYRVLVFGDSITAGRVVNGGGGANNTDSDDALGGYAYRLGEMLDAEVGIVGLSAAGVTVGGAGNTPSFTTSYSLLWSGQARSFAPVPDLVVYNEGTNDSYASAGAVTSGLTTVLASIGYTGSANTFSGLSGTRHLLLRPLNGTKAAEVQAAATNAASVNVVYGDTTGLWITADSVDGLHPYAYSHLNSIAPGVAALAMPLLHPSITPSASAAPLTLTATAGVNSEVLTWTADSGATNGYEVDWKPSSVLPVAGQVKSIVAIVGPGTLTWTDTSAYRLAQSGRYNVVGLH